MEISVVEQNEPVKVPIPDSESVSAQKKKEEKNARRRELYAQKKAEAGGEVKPRKKRSTKNDTPDTTQLNLLVASVFGMIASREGCEHWALSQNEIESITTPLSKIIAENENLKAISEHTNGIALVMACFTVFVPRLIITTKQNKEKKKNEPQRQLDEKRQIKTDSNKTTGKPTTTHREHGSNLSFLGSPVS